MRLELCDWENARARLSDTGIKQIKQATSQPSAKKFAEEHGIKTRSLYEIRSGRAAAPATLVYKTQIEKQQIKSLKGKSSSLEIKEPNIPSRDIRELYNRQRISTHTDKNGCPVYTTQDAGNLDRFKELLRRLGNTQTRVYHREKRYQLRYPKFVYNAIMRKGKEQNPRTDFYTELDEKGRITGQKAVAGTRSRKIKNIDQDKIFCTGITQEIDVRRGNKVRSAAKKAKTVREKLSQESP